jgi:hypothetical protein
MEGFPFGANRALDLLPDYEKPYRSAWDGKRVDEIIGNIQIVSVVYDEKLMQLYKDMMETKKKLSEEE